MDRNQLKSQLPSYNDVSDEYVKCNACGNTAGIGKLGHPCNTMGVTMFSRCYGTLTSPVPTDLPNA